MTTRFLRIALCAATALTTLTTALPATAASTHSDDARLSWGPCPSQNQSSPSQNQSTDPMQCATLRVPMDYARPRGPHITIALSRIPATNLALRRGVLLTNPGGPGVSGLFEPRRHARDMPPPVLERYDLIGFDPRGVGRSTPVSCELTTLPGWDLLYPYPGPGGSIARNIAYARATAASCAVHGGAVLPYITTANTARDMDRIRVALGERTISYLGGSYGTYLGAVYRQLFPRHVDRFILDSAIDPNRIWYQQYRTMSRAADERLDDLTRWVAARLSTYHLGATPDAVRANYLASAAALDRTPLPKPGGAPITGAALRAETFLALHNDGAFSSIAALWRDVATALDNPQSTARTLNSTSSTTDVPRDNFFAALYGVVCGDVAWPRDIARYQRAVRQDRLRWPATDGMPANIWPCAFWHYKPVEPTIRITGGGPRNTLILQNRRDPAIPATGGMRAALGTGAVQITVDAGGHGVLGANDCAGEHAVTFLITGALPAADQHCPQ